MSPPQMHDLHPPVADLCREVLDGLVRRPKRLSPKLFYDARGSDLFEAITALPEYYVTRTEMAILRQCRGELVELLGAGCLLIEPGGGSSQKVRLLIDALAPEAYMPIDISRAPLWHSAQLLAEDYPGLAVHAVCADYSQPIELPELPHRNRRVAFFPGSSIGNFEPDQAVAMLGRLAAMVGPDGALLIGVDLQKEEQLLHAAYNDAQGVTAAFNLNILARLNRDLDADFDIDRFRHRADYNRDLGRVEMHLVSLVEQRVRINGCSIEFNDGEGIHTENSYKYTASRFDQLALAAGFRPWRGWRDPDDLFTVLLYSR